MFWSKKVMILAHGNSAVMVVARNVKNMRLTLVKVLPHESPRHPFPTQRQP